ncbi:MAG: hypothetical protein AAF990_27250, partial [Bacteroidota bacterium]
MRISLVFFLLFFFLTASKAQTSKSIINPEDHVTLHTYEDTLGFLGFAFVNDSLPETRFAAVRKFIPTLVKALKVKNSFSYPFERLRTVSIQYDPDSTFRIFTWQLFVDDNTYRYFGAIQMNTPELELFPLMDRSANMTAVDVQELKNDNWYGNLYYKIQPFDSPEGRRYLLFGMEYYDFHTRRKLIDVLSFDESGKPYFGANVFSSDSQPDRFDSKKRIILQYSAQANISSNFNESMGIVVFDHLKTISLPSGPTAIPDGSYEGLQLQEGKWVHIEKLFNQVSDEAPRPEPV